jgi:hypothetical protein
LILMDSIPKVQIKHAQEQVAELPLTGSSRCSDFVYASAVSALADLKHLLSLLSSFLGIQIVAPTLTLHRNTPLNLAVETPNERIPAALLLINREILQIPAWQVVLPLIFRHPPQ